MKLSDPVKLFILALLVGGAIVLTFGPMIMQKNECMEISGGDRSVLRDCYVHLPRPHPLTWWWPFTSNS